MRIQHKSGSSERLGSELLDGVDIERLEDRVDADPVARGHGMVRPDRLAVDENKIDLPQRHALSPDDRCDRLSFHHREDHLTEAQMRSEVIVQLGIESNS